MGGWGSPLRHQQPQEAGLAHWSSPKGWWRLVNWLPMERGASRVHVQWVNT